MQQIPPAELPGHTPKLPARPAVVPMLPTRIRQPGRQAPLPDAVAVRRQAVPDSAPPFDAEKPVTSRHDVSDPGSGSAVQAGNGAASAAAASPPGAEVPEPCPDEPGPPGDDVSRRGLDGPPGPPDRWPSQFAQVLAETLAGSRPAHQLTPWTTEQARRRIRQLGPMLATGQRPLVRRVMTSVPAEDVVEMTAVVGFGPRVRVLALRLERDQPRAYRPGGSRWRCTAIESA
jgi:hypothetical protein